MKKRVLDIGNCAADHGAIRGLIERIFNAEVVQSHDQKNALEQLNRDNFDLVLINRKLDLDGSDGLAILKQIKSEQGSTPPMMLITNFDEFQKLAQDNGAVPGFGKAQLDAPSTYERLAEYLA